jgi:hypothetical protein
MSNRNILIQLGFSQEQMIMFEDNKACITIVLQESSTRKTKHGEPSGDLQVYLRAKDDYNNMVNTTEDD